MSPFFAKFVFSSLTAVVPVQDAPWIGFVAAAQGSGIKARYEQEAVDGQPQTRLREIICVAQGGTYSIAFNLGMAPLTESDGEVGGWIELRTPTESYIVTRWSARAGEWTIQGGAITVDLPGASCIHFRYTSTGNASISNDPRVTYVTIARVGQ